MHVRRTSDNVTHHPYTNTLTAAADLPPSNQRARGMLCLLILSSNVMKPHLFPVTGKLCLEPKGMIHPAVILSFHWTEMLKCLGDDTNKCEKCIPKSVTRAPYQLKINKKIPS